MLAEGAVRSALAVARAAWLEDRARPKGPVRRRAELEFLPAAVEVLETPSSPAGRLTAWAIMAFFTIALVWSCIGTVDVVAVAEGKIVPTGRSKVVQPVETGVVKAIHVDDGQAVKAGDVLVEIDPTSTTAERERLAAELQGSELDVARLRAALTSDGDPQDAFVVPPGADARLVKMHRILLASEVEENRAKLASFDQEIERKQADRLGIEASIKKLQRTLPLVHEQADAKMKLAAKGWFPRLDALDVQQKAIEQEQDLATAQAQRQENLAAVASLQRQRASTDAEYRKTVLQQLTDAETKVASVGQQLVQATERNKQQTLIAPIDGIVQQLAIHTVGGVVTPAQALLVVVPDDDPLEVEAMILNQDIGFVHVGQPAQVKLETFLFTKYGTIPGHILSISRDSVAQGQQQSQSQTQPQAPPPVESGSGDGQGQKLGLVYPARIGLDRKTIDVDGRSVPLEAGMAVTVEVKTGSRRLIEYLLSPLMRYGHDSMRER